MYRVKIAETLVTFFNAEMTLYTVVKNDESVPAAREAQEEAVELLNREVNREIEIASSIEDAILKKSKDYGGEMRCTNIKTARATHRVVA